MLETAWHYREFAIRPWQPGDRAAAAAVIRQVLEEYGLPWEPDLADRDVIAVEECYLQRGGEFWVVERQSAGTTSLVGTGAYYPLPRDRGKAVEIRKMYLLPIARGRGLGCYLLARLEAAIAARGFAEIAVETASILTEAVRLYERNGYEPSPEVETARCDRAYIKRLRD